MDIVYIKGLRIETIVGIHPWERDNRQPIVIDLTLSSDNRAAAATDHIDQAVDYAAISARVIEFVQASEFFLIETLAEKIAALVLAEFVVKGVRLSLGKPDAVAEVQDVGVVIERGEWLDGK